MMGNSCGDASDDLVTSLYHDGSRVFAAADHGEAENSEGMHGAQHSIHLINLVWARHLWQSRRRPLRFTLCSEQSCPPTGESTDYASTEHRERFSMLALTVWTEPELHGACTDVDEWCVATHRIHHMLRPPLSLRVQPPPLGTHTPELSCHLAF